MNVSAMLKAEFINGRSTKDWLYLGFGLFLQIVAIVYGYITGTPDGILSIISALTGVVSVIFCAQGKISFYAFGYIQLFTYVFGVAIPNHLYGEIWENAFYFLTMVYGTFVWIKRYHIKEDTGESIIISKKLSSKMATIISSLTIIGIIVLYIVLNRTNDPVPLFDSITTIPAVVAQFLMVFGYREQWVGWIIEDISSVIMFVLVGNWVMVAQYIFWTINCIYGWYKWSKTIEN